MKKYHFLYILIPGIYCTINAKVNMGTARLTPYTSVLLKPESGTSGGIVSQRKRKAEMNAIQNPAEVFKMYTPDEEAMYLPKAVVWEKQSPLSLYHQASKVIRTIL